MKEKAKQKSMNSTTKAQVIDVRKEIDSVGEVNVPSDKLWGAQTQRSLEHFNHPYVAKIG